MLKIKFFKKSKYQILFGKRVDFLSKNFLFFFLFLINFAFQAPFSKKSIFVWGFWGHQRINRLAVFTLPPEMLVLYKKHISYLADNAVNPDKRRYAVVGEAARHYIDLEAYSDSATFKLPLFWADAVKKIGEDTLLLNGVVPWAIQQYKYRLTEAFREKNLKNILRLSADLGHYIADANVPLHTTRNYNGQLSKQEGIHAFWESRLPELYAEDYDMFVGVAQYESKVAQRAFKAVRGANVALDSVLKFEKKVSEKISETQKYTLEDRNGAIVKTYSREFSQQYHALLGQQVERQMRASVKMVGDFWFTCWVDAGQPDLNELAKLNIDEQTKTEDETDKRNWLQRLFKVRPEGEN